MPEAKSARLLTIYSRLVNGEALSKAELAAAYYELRKYRLLE